VRILAEELDREGMWFDKEIEKLRAEIKEWKEENKFLANRLQSQNEVNEELRDEIIKLKKEKDHLSLDVAQRNFIIARQEKQIADLTTRLYKGKAPTPQPPETDQQPVIKRPSPTFQKDAIKDPSPGKSLPPKEKDRAPTPISRKTISSITRADEISVNISRPTSVGLSNYRDEEEIEAMRDKRDVIEGSNLKEKKVLADLDRPVAPIPDNLKPEPNDDQYLPPLDITRPITFTELKQRWRRSQASSPTRSQLLLMVMILILWLRSRYLSSSL